MAAATTVPLSNGDKTRAMSRYGRVPRTQAVPLIPPDADDATWLEARRFGDGGFRLGASEFAAVLGASPHASPYSLWWSKQPGWERPAQTRPQRWGHRVEVVIGEVFEEDHPEMMVARSGAGLWRHPLIPWLVCTPDFLALVPTYANEGDTRRVRSVHIEPIEAKSDRGGKGWGKPGTDRIPAHHRVQAITQAMIFRAPRAWVVRNDAAYPIEITDVVRAEFEAWVIEGAAFVASLEAGVVPDVDGHPATLKTVTKRYANIEDEKEVEVDPRLLGRYDYLSTELARVEDEYRAVQTAIRIDLGDAEFGVDAKGRRRVQHRAYKREAYNVRASIVDGLWPIAAGEDTA